MHINSDLYDDLLNQIVEYQNNKIVDETNLLLDDVISKTNKALIIENQNNDKQFKDECQLIYESLQEIIMLIIQFGEQNKNNYQIMDRTNYALHFLQILEDQFEILILLISDKEQKRMHELKQRYIFDDELYIKAENSKQINYYALRQINHVFLTNTLTNLIRICNRYMIGNINKDQSKLIDELIVYNSHLNILVRVFASAIDMDQNDLISQSRTHPDWVALQRVSKYVKLSQDPNQVQKSYYNFMKSIRLGHATFLKKSKFKNALIKDLIYVSSTIWYILLDRRANNRAIQHICDMQIDSAMSVMNLIEKPGIKHVMQLGISPIRTNFKIYIDPVVLPITINYMKQQYESGQINKITKDEIEYVNLNIHKTHNIYRKDRSKLRIRILCSEEIVRVDHEDSIFEQFLHHIHHQNVVNFRSILIHIHGGGFIAMSSSSHQNYTREWANQLGIPIFSIDYSLSPDYKYPVALDDCWQCYNWILRYVYRHFNIIPEKIYLAGDSAGGNLCCALTGLCIKFGIKIPDGLLISYPVLDLKLKFSPSHLNGLGDFLLSHTLMDLCIKAYTDIEGCYEFDPFRSPNHLSDEILREFPPVRILVGTKDPLMDHTHRLANKLLKNDVDVKISLYEGMSHGFLSFYMLGGMRESKQCIIDSIIYLKELMQFKY